MNKLKFHKEILTVIDGEFRKTFNITRYGEDTNSYFVNEDEFEEGDLEYLNSVFHIKRHPNNLIEIKDGGAN